MVRHKGDDPIPRLNRISTVGILIMLLSILLIATPTATSAFAPWGDSDYSRRKSVSINGTEGAGTDYQVFLPVIYDSDMQADFDDLRFTTDDGVTLLDHWIESYVASTSAIVWVEVSANLDTDQTIYMYYGNSTVSDTSNGTATFLFYEDWESESVDPAKWDTITNDGSITFDDTDATHGSIARVSGTAGTDVYEIRSVPTSAAPTSIFGRVKIEITAAASQRTMWGMGNTGGLPMAFVISIEGTESFQIIDEDSHDDSQGMLAGYFDVYHSFMITRSGAVATLYSDYIPIVAGDCDADIIGAANVITVYVRDSEDDVFMDWSAQRKYVYSGPVNGDFGFEEEYFSAPDVVDWVLIFVGLIMIPTSTVYLAYGVKHDRSSNRLYYGLLIFMLGCGLLVGGILP